MYEFHKEKQGFFPFLHFSHKSEIMSKETDTNCQFYRNSNFPDNFTTVERKTLFRTPFASTQVTEDSPLLAWQQYLCPSLESLPGSNGWRHLRAQGHYDLYACLMVSFFDNQYLNFVLILTFFFFNIHKGALTSGLPPPHLSQLLSLRIQPQKIMYNT